MTKLKRPPKGKWNIGDIGSFGGVMGRVVACDPALGGWPLFWVTTDPDTEFGMGRKGMMVKFDLEGKFQSWHKEPLLEFIRRPSKKELLALTKSQEKSKIIEIEGKDNG